MKFEIENIPVRESGSESSPNSKYNFNIMKVGQSFIVPPEMRYNVAAAATWYGKRHNMKFSVRITDGVLRCGRIA